MYTYKITSAYRNTQLYLKTYFLIVELLHTNNKNSTLKSSKLHNHFDNHLIHE